MGRRFRVHSLPGANARCAGVRWWLPLLVTLATFAALVPDCPAQDQRRSRLRSNRRDDARPAARRGPTAAERPARSIPFDGFPLLRTIPVPHDRPQFNVQMVNAAVLPRDKEGIWVLDFAFKPLRIKTVEIPGKGRIQVHYLYYKVVNHTGKPRMFVPQFIMVNEAGQKIRRCSHSRRRFPSSRCARTTRFPLLGAVNVMGVIPPSTKPDVDDAVFGVATWDKWDPKSDRFSIYVRGLSDGYKEFPQDERQAAGHQVQDACGSTSSAAATSTI